MDRSDFISALALYGSDVDRWPEEVRGRAQDAAAGSAELRALVEEERRFERALDSLPFEEADPGLAARIIMTAEAHRTQETATVDAADRTAELGLFFTDLFMRFFTLRPAMGLALALVIGIALGYGDSLANGPAGPADPIDIGSFLYNGEDLP